MIFLAFIGLLLFIIFILLFGKKRIGCFIYMILGFILWKMGVLTFVATLLMNVIRWIFVLFSHLIEKLIHSGDNAASFIAMFNKISHIVITNIL
ncbi:MULTISPECIES: hypothetical protein [Bacillus]|uniref:hypothetical protein n=1 Tax=Bacillus TaxID=1386 RepID=UPI00031ECC70|nr:MULTISPECIES: hypothetical protein [Bacillus]